MLKNTVPAQDSPPAMDVKFSLPIRLPTVDLPAVNELSDDGIDAFLAENPVAMVDFFAPWCGPCMAMTPAIESIAEEFSGRAAVAKVNVDLCPDAAERFGIRAVPTIIFFRNGESVEVIAGARSKEDLAKKLMAHLR